MRVGSAEPCRLWLLIVQVSWRPQEAAAILKNHWEIPLPFFSLWHLKRDCQGRTKEPCDLPAPTGLETAVSQE